VLRKVEDEQGTERLADEEQCNVSVKFCDVVECDRNTNRSWTAGVRSAAGDHRASHDEHRDGDDQQPTEPETSGWTRGSFVERVSPAR